MAAARRTANGAAHQPQPPEQMLQRLHTILYDEVARSVMGVAGEETTWTEGEMVKRIVRYMYKSASNQELLTLAWPEAVTKFVHGAMSGYAGACQERPWFYDLDLGPTFGHAAWEVLSANSHRDRPSYAQVVEAAEKEYAQWLDEVLHSKAMWISVEKIFPDDSKVQEKIFSSLKKTYQAALDLAVDDRRPLDDMARLQNFLRKWMEDSLGRAWCAVGESQRYITESIAVKLFSKLMAPFGPKHPFSCMPLVLTEHIGRPPANWQFIKQQANVIFRRWEAPEFNKKRCRRAAPPAPREQDSEPETAREQLKHCKEDLDDPLGPPTAEDDDFAEPQGGHPDCTSAEDCLGSPSDSLIRHILHEKPGDVYCNSCWHSFLSQNPALEGVEEG